MTNVICLLAQIKMLQSGQQIFKQKVLLGIQFDNKLSFDYHSPEICKKAGGKLYSLGRVTPYMSLLK